MTLLTSRHSKSSRKSRAVRVCGSSLAGGVATVAGPGWHRVCVWYENHVARVHPVPSQALSEHGRVAPRPDGQRWTAEAGPAEEDAAIARQAVRKMAISNLLA